MGFVVPGSRLELWTLLLLSIRYIWLLHSCNFLKKDSFVITKKCFQNNCRIVCVHACNSNSCIYAFNSCRIAFKLVTIGFGPSQLLQVFLKV